MTYVDREQYDEHDFERMRERLEQCLAALDALLSRPGFGAGTRMLGAELELFLIDGQGHPLARNADVRSHVADSRLTLEVDRFNVEGNLTPVALAGAPFTAMAREMDEIMVAVERAAGELGGGVVAVGTLPTLKAEDLGGSALTDEPRYQALDHRLRVLRRQPYRIDIAGEDHLVAEASDVSLEGANTSFQLHLRVDPADFADIYNAAQIATAPVLAVSGNSPFFLDHRLWEETRVALFKQSVDHRDALARLVAPARVSFGHRWLERSAIELFSDMVRTHPPLLSVLSDEDPRATVYTGGVPGLDELRVHLSSTWAWNRPVYDPADGGHLRIELRALPAGPTAVDMAANGAFLLGLTLAISEAVSAWTSTLAFEQARDNFYRAAQSGLDAELRSPFNRSGLEPASARDLALRLLEPAREALVGAGVEPHDVDGLFGVLEGRIASGRTGARWQRHTVAALEQRMGRPRAVAAMLHRYRDAAASRAPVHTWPLPT